ncbi:LytTR family DNA-binding domain-containing protein [Patescibacteria group bacterium]|nr:LytTR family DNA-binding domain-containing protein [Patescibacteria group bacterium]
MLKINTLIVDDEQPAIEELYYQCSQYIDKKNIYDLSNPKQTTKTIQDHDIQLIFLDINMPYISGIKLAGQIAKLDNPPYIIFVTAYDEYAVKAFELNAVDYIQKPIDAKRFEQTIEKITDKINNPQSAKITKNKIKQTTQFLGGKITAVGTNPNDRYIFNLQDITHFHAEGPVVFVHTGKKCSKRVHYQLQELEKALPENFVRAHKSHIVNTEHISRMYLWQKSNYQIELNNQETIPVSRRYSARVKAKLNW